MKITQIKTYLMHCAPRRRAVGHQGQGSRAAGVAEAHYCAMDYRPGEIY